MQRARDQADIYQSLQDLICANISYQHSDFRGSLDFNVRALAIARGLISGASFGGSIADKAALPGAFGMSPAS